jgi:hypothetical protein
MVADIAFLIGVVFSPLFISHTEKRDIQQVSFACVNSIALCVGNCVEDDSFFDCIGMDSVVNFCKCSLKVPFKIKILILNLF